VPTALSIYCVPPTRLRTTLNGIAWWLVRGVRVNESCGRVLMTADADADECAQALAAQHWIDEVSNPIGAYPCLMTADGHLSNTSNISFAMAMSVANCHTLITPSHHTHVLQQMDAKHGPISEVKKMLHTLVVQHIRAKRNQMLQAGKSGVHVGVSIAEVAGILEKAIHLGMTPPVLQQANKLVGFYTDTDGAHPTSPTTLCLCTHVCL
jgi:hypothetical protein